jgi:uncharacterized protein (TIGR02186 family)
VIRRLLPAVLLWAALVPVARAEEIVSGLSQARVSITADFSGEEILVFGAVRREAPVPRDAPLHVIVTVRGPETTAAVWRKGRVAGIWVNREAVTIDRAPSFYAVETSGPLDQILSQTEDLRHGISIPRVVRAIGSSAEAADAPAFVEALVRLRTEAGLYTVRDGAVTLVEDTLFRADVRLPANLNEGLYRVRMYLTRKGQVVDWQERTILVRKEGVERVLYTLSQQQPAVYGALSLLIALVAGWTAALAFRLMRG